MSNLSRHPVADKFRKKHVVMKKGIPVFMGKAASGMINGVQFSLVCPDVESCEEIWNRIMTVPLDREGVQKAVLCRESDIEMDVSAAKLSVVGS